MKKIFLAQRTLVLIGVIAAAFFFSTAIDAFALSYSPSTIYPGTPYTLSEFVSNSSGSTISVTKDCFYWKNGIYGGSWSNGVINVPSGGGTATCSSTGDTAGSQMSFQMNIWRPDYNGTVSWGTTGFTVASPPVASVSISGPSPVSYGGGSYLTVTPTNAYGCSVSGPGYWAYSDTWWTGGLYSDTTFTASCTPNSGATGSPTSSFTVRVNPPPSYSLSVSTSGSGSVSCNGGSCASSYPSGTSLTLTASPSSGYSFSGWSGACSGTGSCSLTMNGNKSVNASFAQQPFDYYLSVYGNISVTAGQSGATTIMRTLSSGLTQSVSLSASDLPSGASASFQNNPASPSAGSSLTIYTSNGTPPGSYAVTVTGSPLGKTASFILSVLPRSVAKLSVGNFALTGTRMNGQQNFEQNTSFSYVARVSNTSSVAEANGIFVYLQRWMGNGYEDIPGATASWDGPLAPNGSKNLVLSTTFSSGSWRIRSCVRHYDTPFDNQGNFVDDCSSASYVTFASPPPPPKSYCVANINNAITGTSDWRNTASINVSGCPSAEYQDMWVTGFAGSNEWTADKVFDVSSWLWRDWNPSADSGASDAMRTAEHDCLSGGGECAGGFSIVLPNLPVYGGFTGTRIYVNDNTTLTGDKSIYKKSVLLRGGKYGYYTKDTFAGNYVCYTQNISSYNQTTQAVTTRDNPVKVPFSATANLMACIEQGGTGNYYKNSSCTQVDRTASLFAQANCPNGRVDIPFSPTLSIPTQPTTPSFEHSLSVQSKLDGAAQAGVSITQVSVSSSFNFPLNYFAGITDYTKLAERNLTVVLEAPSVHPQGGALKARPDSWTGCDSISSNGRECTVSFAFTALGGQNKTVIANYSSNLDAPIVLTSPASCDANGGKVNVYLQSAVSGATGYHIYRSTSPFTAARKNWFNIAHAQTAVELDSDNNPANGIQPFTTAPTQANPFIDRNLSPNATYYYRATAYNSSVSSPASAQTSRAASLPCPDLVVEPNSVEIINTANPPQVISPTAVPSNTSIKFRAKIRNQGGATPTLPSPGFYNQFTLDNLTTQPFSGSQQPLAKLIQGELSGFLTTGSWTPTTGSHSLQVCADRPPLPPSFGSVNESSEGVDRESNNCLASPFSFSVVAPISVQLQCEQAGGTFKNDYCVIDYSQASSLKWTTNATSCSWITPPSDTTGTVSGTSLSLTDLLSKLNFKYQLECSR